MAKRPCIDCGALTDRTRCPEHTRTKQRQRDAHRATIDPDHRARHRAARNQWAPIVDQGGVTCYRCPNPIVPGTAWDIDEVPGGWQPSHASCNRAAGANVWRAGTP